MMVPYSAIWIALWFVITFISGIIHIYAAHDTNESIYGGFGFFEVLLGGFGFMIFIIAIAEKAS